MCDASNRQQNISEGAVASKHLYCVGRKHLIAPADLRDLALDTGRHDVEGAGGAVLDAPPAEELDLPAVHMQLHALACGAEIVIGEDNPH